MDQIRVSYAVIEVSVDESPRPGEAPEDHACRLALAKAFEGWSRVAQEGVPVLGADTVVVLDGALLGKPADRAEALAMLQRLSGHTHRVLSAVALMRGELRRVLLSSSEVTLRKLQPSEREAYVATGEPFGKAGGYAVQGLGALFVSHLAGSYSGVMGLPLQETALLLAEFGVLPAWLAPPAPA